jgi:hypothetical protein
MDPGSRVGRDPMSDPMSGAQPTSDEPGTGGQFESPVSRGQGKWDQRQGKSVRFLCHLPNFPCRTYARAPRSNFRHLHLYFYQTTAASSAQMTGVKAKVLPVQGRLRNATTPQANTAAAKRGMHPTRPVAVRNPTPDTLSTTTIRRALAAGEGSRQLQAK